MPTNDITELLRRVKSGDRDARRQLIAVFADEERLRGAILRIARRLMPRDHPARDLLDSQDLIQSALRTAFDEMSAFRGESPGSFYGWLRAIIRTKVNRARRRVVRPAPEPLPADEEDPVELRDLAEALRVAIRGLSLDQRLVIELRLQGLRSPEIGKALGIKPATVRKREQRAIEQLRKSLHAGENGGPPA